MSVPHGVAPSILAADFARLGERVADAFLAEHPHFSPAGPPSDMPVWDHPTVPRYSQTLPHRDGTDGFFIATLGRR